MPKEQYDLQPIGADALYKLLPFIIRANDPRGAIQAFMEATASEHNFYLDKLQNLPRLQDPTKAATFSPEDLGESVTEFAKYKELITSPLELTDDEKIHLEQLKTTLTRSIAAEGMERGVLALLASTVGADLHNRYDPATNRELIQTALYRHHIKGTHGSVYILGRILGFVDLKVRELWSRFAIKDPKFPASSLNSADFDGEPEERPYWPANGDNIYDGNLTRFTDRATGDGTATVTSEEVFHAPEGTSTYDPTVLDDGPEYVALFTQLSVDTNNNGWWNNAVNEHNPFGTFLTDIGARPVLGSYYMAGGDSLGKAFVEIPLADDSTVTFEAVTDGAWANGIELKITADTGGLQQLQITGPQSKIKFKSSYFDLALASDILIFSQLIKAIPVEPSDSASLSDIVVRTFTGVEEAPDVLLGLMQTPSGDGLNFTFYGDLPAGLQVGHTIRIEGGAPGLPVTTTVAAIDSEGTVYVNDEIPSETDGSEVYLTGASIRFLTSDTSEMFEGQEITVRGTDDYDGDYTLSLVEENEAVTASGTFTDSQSGEFVFSVDDVAITTRTVSSVSGSYLSPEFPRLVLDSVVGITQFSMVEVTGITSINGRRTVIEVDTVNNAIVLRAFPDDDMSYADDYAPGATVNFGRVAGDFPVTGSLSGARILADPAVHKVISFKVYLELIATLRAFFEKIRPITRTPRYESFGFMLRDTMPYAPIFSLNEVVLQSLSTVQKYVLRVDASKNLTWREAEERDFIAVVDAGDGDVDLTVDSTNGIIGGSTITISGTLSYDGVYTVVSVVDNTSIRITHEFEGTTVGLITASASGMATTRIVQMDNSTRRLYEWALDDASGTPVFTPQVVESTSTFVETTVVYVRQNAFTGFIYLDAGILVGSAVSPENIVDSIHGDGTSDESGDLGTNKALVHEDLSAVVDAVSEDAISTARPDPRFLFQTSPEDDLTIIRTTQDDIRTFMGPYFQDPQINDGFASVEGNWTYDSDDYGTFEGRDIRYRSTGPNASIIEGIPTGDAGRSDGLFYNYPIRFLNYHGEYIWRSRETNEAVLSRYQYDSVNDSTGGTRVDTILDFDGEIEGASLLHASPDVNISSEGFGATPNNQYWELPVIDHPWQSEDTRTVTLPSPKFVQVTESGDGKARFKVLTRGDVYPGSILRVSNAEDYDGVHIVREVSETTYSKLFTGTSGAAPGFTNLLTTNTNGILAGMSITVSGTANYNGTYTVVAVEDVTSITIQALFTVSQSGTYTADAFDFVTHTAYASSSTGNLALRVASMQTWEMLSDAVMSVTATATSSDPEVNSATMSVYMEGDGFIGRVSSTSGSGQILEMVTPVLYQLEVDDTLRIEGSDGGLPVDTFVVDVAPIDPPTIERVLVEESTVPNGLSDGWVYLTSFTEGVVLDTLVLPDPSDPPTEPQTYTKGHTFTYTGAVVPSITKLHLELSGFGVFTASIKRSSTDRPKVGLFGHGAFVFHGGSRNTVEVTILPNTGSPHFGDYSVDVSNFATINGVPSWRGGGWRGTGAWSVATRTGLPAILTKDDGLFPE